MKYWAVYKCPLCGTLNKQGQSYEINKDDLPKILGKVVQNQQFAGNAYLYKVPMYAICKCSDGNVGLAQFAGFVEDKIVSKAESDSAKFLTKLIKGSYFGGENR